MSTTIRPPAWQLAGWVQRVTPWICDDTGRKWNCRVFGVHAGAEVVQRVRTHHWDAGDWTWQFSPLRVISRGRTCPTWCCEHLILDDGDDDAFLHSGQLRAGLSTEWVITVEQREDSAGLGEPKVWLPEHFGELAVADARAIAEALLEATGQLEAEAVQR